MDGESGELTSQTQQRQQLTRQSSILHVIDSLMVLRYDHTYDSIRRKRNDSTSTVVTLVRRHDNA